MVLENVVGYIQNNRTLNAIKNALNRTAYINIGIAFFIFIFYQLERVGMISQEYRELAVTLYHFYLFMMATIFAYFVAEDAIDSEVDASIKLAVTLLSVLPGAVLVPSGFIVTYPMVSLFFASILALFFNGLATFRYNSKRLPQAVVDYYNRIWPIVIMMTVVLILIIVFPVAFNAIAYALLIVTQWLSSLVAILVIISVICIFWILGIHGVAVIGTLMRPFWIHMLLWNAYQVLLGQPPLFIGSETFFAWAVWIGGSGCTIGLTFDMLFFTRSKHLRDLSKACAPSNIFNINENIVFGTPIVDNKYFKIPFFLAPVLCGIIAYSAFKLGFVTTPALVAPWVIPMPIGMFIATLGDWRSLVLAVILIITSMAVYLPFLIAYDRSLVAESTQ